MEAENEAENSKKEKEETKTRQGYLMKKGSSVFSVTLYFKTNFIDLEST